MSDITLAHNTLELLSPARDADTGIAAIDHGADAVYIGGPAFGARAAAGNTMNDLARLCEYAHRYHARIFMALNTLMTDKELPSARALAFEAAQAGIDVLIIQDMGLLEGELPDIELHASTQCDIRTPEKAAFLERVGFSQMVLARELSLEEIARIRARLTRARIEYFIHGALCVSYSGQCYMSEAMLKRSANRGACAQLCRLPYDVSTLEGTPLARRKHVLSLKDNNQSANLEALIDAGVSSFKIEGRLKDINYVKNITAYYRQCLDEIIARRPTLKRSSDGITQTTFQPSPQKSFQRGATDYFVHARRYDRPYELAQLESPKNTGVEVGRVIDIDRDAIIVKTLPGITIANADGLTYMGADNVIHGAAVNRAETLESGLVKCVMRERIASLDGLGIGTLLMRNRDQAFNRILAGESASRRIPVTMSLSTPKDGVSLCVSDGQCQVQVSETLAHDAPKNPARNQTTLEENLAKVGDTHYCLESLSLEKPFPIFIPASTANRLRREALNALTAARAEHRIRARRAPADETTPYPEKILGFQANVANKSAKAFYERHGAHITAPAFEIRAQANATLMTCRHCVRASLKLCPKMLRYFAQMAQNTPKELFRPEALVLTNSAGERFMAEFHCKNEPCEMTIRQMPSDL